MDVLPTPRYITPFGRAVEPDAFPPGSAMEMLWGAGKQILSLTIEQGQSRTSLKAFEPDPDKHFPSGVLEDGSRIEICVLEEYLCNAFAGQTDGDFVVGVYSGFPAVLSELAGWIWADRNLLPQFGDISRLTSADNGAASAYPPGLCSLLAIANGEFERAVEDGRTRGARDEISRLHASLCPVRRAAMANTLYSAFRCLWFHEMGHVLLGHVDAIADRFNLSAMFEAPKDNVVASAVSQYLEVQADSVAFDIVVNSAFHRFEDAFARGVADVPQPAEEAQTPLTPRQVVISSVLGCILVPLVLRAQEMIKGHGKPEVAGTHPPLSVRRDLLLAAIAQAFRGSERANLIETAGSAFRALFYMHPAFYEWFHVMRSGQEIDTEKYLGDLEQAYAASGGLRLEPRRHPSRSRRS